jgi:hypothetical protein
VISGETSRSAERRLGVPAADVFALLSDPARHPDTDASGMVVGAVTTDRLTTVGQVFTMDMQYDGCDGQVTRYQTDNHVDVLEPGRALGWRVAAAGEPLLGWGWRYTVKPDGDGCVVSLLFDWTGTTPEVVERFGVPNFDEDDLGRSLAVLEATLTST